VLLDQRDEPGGAEPRQRVEGRREAGPRGGGERRVGQPAAGRIGPPAPPRPGRGLGGARRGPGGQQRGRDRDGDGPRPSPRPAAGSAAASAARDAAGSSSSAVATATGTGQYLPGGASIMRSSSQPRGRTGGNSVDRWQARSAAPGSPLPSHSRNDMPGSDTHLPSGVRSSMTRASSAYRVHASAGSPSAPCRRTGRVRQG